MTVKLRLPPGFLDNGTEYSASGRWHTGDLVRWRDGAIVPVAGWRSKYNSLDNTPVAPLWVGNDEAIRGGIAMHVDASGETNIFFGSNKKLYRLTNSNVVEDVTPLSFVAQPKDAVIDTGYGNSAYGIASYGTARPATQSSPLPVFSWGFSDWGFWPIAVARGVPNLHLYIKKSTDLDFIQLANSPTGCNDAIVTDERFVLTIGTPDDNRLVQWSDRERYDIWTPTVDNSAGSFRAAGVGRLLRCVKVPGEVLIVGETDAFRAVYIGPPYIYGITRVGNKCGIIGPNAIAVTATFAIWLGDSSFWIYDGTVREVPCEVFGYLKETIDNTQRSKTFAFDNSKFNEVWWLYQSNDSPTNDLDSYIIFNYQIGCWYYGKLQRTFALDAGPLRNVTMVDHNGKVYDHDIVNGIHVDPDGNARKPWIAAGPIEAENGSRLTSVSYVYPDIEPVNAALTMTLSVRDFPNAPIRYSREFALLNPTSTVGIMGREIHMRLEASDDPDQPKSWKIGDMRADPTANIGPRR
jgi:hypothetical protein